MVEALPAVDGASPLTPQTTRVDIALARRLNPIETKLDELMTKFDNAAPPAKAAMPETVESTDKPSKGKGATIFSHAAEYGAKHAGKFPVEVVIFKATVAEVWAEYTTGIGASPSLRSLEAEYGCRWRGYKGGRAAWDQHKVVYDEIERRLAAGEAEAAAVGAVQAMLNAHLKPQPAAGKSGRKPALAPWSELVKELRVANPKKRARPEEE